eukprot:IDg3912t1
MLETKFEFANMRDHWKTTSEYDFIEAPNFRKTVMPRKRFDDIWRDVRWSDQPEEHPEGMSNEEYRWSLIDDFITRFNDEREFYFHTSEYIRNAEYEESNLNEENKGLPHGCVELRELVASLFHSGVVKTASKQFPIAALNYIEMYNRSERNRLMRLEKTWKPEIKSFVWFDTNRRFFITTADGLREGKPYSRRRMRQVDQAPNALSDMVESKRVKFSILSMCVVDAWILFHEADEGTNESSTSQNQFYKKLAHELISNKYDTIRSRERRQRTDLQHQSRDFNISGPSGGIYMYLTTIKSRKRNSTCAYTNNLFQGRFQ